MTARDDRLRELAMEATPGPWGLAHTDGQGFAVHHGAHTTVALYADRDDAAYIAAASPDVVLGLLDRLAAAEAERDYHHARADVLLAKVSGRVALRGGKPGDYWAEWHRTHCAAAEAAARAELERDRLAAGIEALIASPDDTQWWEVVPYMDPPEQDEVVEVQVIAADRLRALLSGAADRA